MEWCPICTGWRPLWSRLYFLIKWQCSSMKSREWLIPKWGLVMEIGNVKCCSKRFASWNRCWWAWRCNKMNWWQLGRRIKHTTIDNNNRYAKSANNWKPMHRHVYYNCRKSPNPCFPFPNDLIYSILSAKNIINILFNCNTSIKWVPCASARRRSWNDKPAIDKSGKKPEPRSTSSKTAYTLRK